MKRCVLCKGTARTYCESDEASLCWDCDAKVHSANFLVARHSRNLLCHVCQSPMPWSASGAKLAPTVSVCEKCVGGNVAVRDADESSSVDNGVEDEEDNQVAPWSPPPASSSSSEGEEDDDGSSSSQT